MICLILILLDNFVYAIATANSQLEPIIKPNPNTLLYDCHHYFQAANQGLTNPNHQTMINNEQISWINQKLKPPNINQPQILRSNRLWQIDETIANQMISNYDETVNKELLHY